VTCSKVKKMEDYIAEIRRRRRIMTDRLNINCRSLSEVNTDSGIVKSGSLD